MISTRSSDCDLTCFLDDSIYGDVDRTKHLGMEHSAFPEVEVRVFRSLARKVGFETSFRFLFLLRGNAIPCLGSSIMKIIDRVEIVVFGMPAEHTEQLTNVEEWSGDAWNTAGSLQPASF